MLRRLARAAAVLALTVPVVATAEVRRAEPGTTIDPVRAAIGPIALGQEVPAIWRGLRTLGLTKDCADGIRFPRRASQIRPREGADGEIPPESNIRQVQHTMYCGKRPSSRYGLLVVSNKPGSPRWTGEPRAMAFNLRGDQFKWPRTEGGVGMGSTAAETREGLPDRARCGRTACAIVTCRKDRPFPGRMTRFGFKSGRVFVITIFGQWDRCFSEERIAEEIGA